MKQNCCCFRLWLLVVFQAGAVLNAQSCTLNSDMPGPFLDGGDVLAWPHVGWRTFDTSWNTFTSTGVKYVFCDASTPSNCGWGPGDAVFSGTQKTKMRQAFANWTSAKTANNSNVSFYEGSSTTIPDPFHIDVRRMSVGSMPNMSGAEQGAQFTVDENNDGNPDGTRLQWAYIDIRTDVTDTDYLTFLVAHEIGHSMALEGCDVCTLYTTVMSEAQYTINSTPTGMPYAPSACDNQQVHTTAF